MDAAKANAGEQCLRDGQAVEGVCFRCGTFVCATCRRWQSEQPLCLDCRKRLGHTASREATNALLLASVGLITLLPGIAAIVLAQRELRRIERCEVSDAGEAHARFARALGIFEGVGAAVMTALLVLRFSQA